MQVLFNTIGWSWPAFWWFRFLGPSSEDDPEAGLYGIAGVCVCVCVCEYEVTLWMWMWLWI